MSKEELVEAYVGGAISRRVFIRRLIAAGVSLSAALVYADALQARPRASRNRDHHGFGFIGQWDTDPETDAPHFTSFQSARSNRVGPLSRRLR